MDFRTTAIAAADLDCVRQMIVNRKISYQPLVFRDDLEVGEGWAFENNTSDTWPPRKGVIYWPGHPASIADLAVHESDRDAFRAANARLRDWYEDNVRLIVDLVGDVRTHDFLELGCNTGYVIHRLSQLGARRAVGVDYGDFGDVFEWFNRVTGTRSEFLHGVWDSTRHRMADSDLPEADVAISVSVTCHVSDPTHMLAYLCHKARKAVFFMVPLSGKDDVSISFRHPPNYYQKHLRWPCSFDSEVLPSARLVEMGLEQSGFGDIQRPKDGVFLARRTGSGRSVYSAVTDVSEAPMLVGSVGVYNVVKCGRTFLGVPQSLGPLDLTDKAAWSLQGIVIGSSAAEVAKLCTNS